MVIAELNPERRAVWMEVFNDISDVEIIASDARSLHGLPELDAELMPGVLVHERYGGIERRWESLVLSTQHDQNMPPLVVTTPTLPAHFQEGDQRGGARRRVLVPDVAYTPIQETSAVFSSMFRAVRAFNESKLGQAISVIGFSTDLMNLRDGDIRGHAEAVRAAYLSEIGTAAVRSRRRS
jgi:hypothetical protein